MEEENIDKLDMWNQYMKAFVWANKTVVIIKYKKYFLNIKIFHFNQKFLFYNNFL